MKDLAENIRLCILKDIHNYWKKGYIDIEEDVFRSWGVATYDIADYAMESLLHDFPFTFDLVYDADYVLRIKAKDWRPPQTGYFIYKYYSGNRLVYIGRAVNPVKRFFEHINEDRKYTKVDRIDLYQCKNKSDMLLLERLLIAKEHPPWNIVDAENGEPSFSLPEIKFEQHNIISFVTRY